MNQTDDASYQTKPNKLSSQSSGIVTFLHAKKSQPQGFGFENEGTEALSFRKVYGCFFRLTASQQTK